MDISGACYACERQYLGLGKIVVMGVIVLGVGYMAMLVSFTGGI